MENHIPRILTRRIHFSCPWIEVEGKDARLYAGADEETYYSVKQKDYVGIVAVNEDGKIPLIKQYRPAIESFVWEFPAGTVEIYETPELCCRRELFEEAGIIADEITLLGEFYPDTGRLGNHLFGYFVKGRGPVEDFRPEKGTQMRLFSYNQIKEMIFTGKFLHLLHIGLLSMANEKRMKFGLG